MTTILSDRLLALLYGVKNTYGQDLSNAEIINLSLGELYCSNMALRDMISQCLEACIEICKTPEFGGSVEIKTKDLISNLLKAPYVYFNDPNNKKLYPDMKDVVSFDHIYDSYLSELISVILLTNISWSDQYKEYYNSKVKQS